MTNPDMIGRIVLLPFDEKEALKVSTAARRAGRCARTIREWCEEYNIGRKVGGQWRVSAVALAMFLDDDKTALAAYLCGDRTSNLVTQYFRRLEIKTAEIGESGKTCITRAGHAA